MSRVAYTNGQYLPHRGAAVHIEDRSYQFADGVYEVIAVVGGRLLDDERHLARLARSLAELRITAPMSNAALRVVIAEVVRRNGVRDGIVYVQITRGADPRAVDGGVAVIMIPDIRWQRCDIKSVALLPNVLGKQQAKEAGAFEAWQVDREGKVSEGTSTNAWIVTPNATVVTRQADSAILDGVTRLAVLDIIRREGYNFVERPFSVVEAKSAREAFLTSTVVGLLPVVKIDGVAIGNGQPGLLSRKLRECYLTHEAAAK